MISKRYMICVLIKGNIVFIFFLFLVFFEYKVCVVLVCIDVMMDKSIGIIDLFFLLV